MKDKWGNLVQF